MVVFPEYSSHSTDEVDIAININTLRLRQNGCHFADDIFKHIFLSENIRIWSKIPLKFVPTGTVNNISALVQIMAWRRSGDKPLSEPMLVSLRTHICVAWPQGVKDTVGIPPLCHGPQILDCSLISCKHTILTKLVSENQVVEVNGIWNDAIEILGWFMPLLLSK